MFFNASLRALAPSAPMRLTVCLCCLLAMSAVHPFSSLRSCSPHKFNDCNVVFVFNASLSAIASSAPMLLPACWCWLLVMSAIHSSSSLSFCSRSRSSDWSVVLVFNASLSALAPSAPILLPVCCCLLLAMSVIHPPSSFSSCEHLRLSDWSVVFVFNASLSAFAPSSPISFPVCYCLFVVFNPSIFLAFFLITC